MRSVPPNSLGARDARVLLHPYSDAQLNQSDGAMVITHGKGVYVYDETGREYLESMAGLWCVSLGFGHTRLAEAAATQMRTLGFYHGFFGKSHPAQIELAERLLEIAPVPMSKVFFASSGSEANDTALRLIWYRSNALGQPNKKTIIGRRNGYHGTTVAAASISGIGANHTGFDQPIARFVHADCPHYDRHGRPGESEEDYAVRLAAQLDALIVAEGPDTVAAFFAEPIMGAGGILLPPRTYFERIQAVLAKHEVLLVADEVICGFGRTGNMWGAQTYGMRPDIVTCGKALSSGFQPISAVMMTDDVFRPIAHQSHDLGYLGHGFTFGGHPVTAAVALETLKIYEEMDIVGRARAIAPMMRNGIGALADHPMVGEIQSVGALSVLELVADKTSRTAFPPEQKVGAYLLHRALDHGLITRAIGNRIGLSPPLVISEAEIAMMYERLSRALDDTYAWVGHEA